MKILFVGDVVGKPGRALLANAAGGFGITPEILAEMEELPIDCYTSGNHIWDKKEGLPLLDDVPRLLRPANYPDGNPGSGLYVGETPAGIPVATINLEGQVFMKPLESPFRVAERLLEGLDSKVNVILVDFHAEATSEKQALGVFLDGRATAVVGTHTHVPTADERVLPGGTAFISDVGMTGPYESVIGMRSDRVLRRFLLQSRSVFEVAKRDVRLAAVVIEADETTGKAQGIERLLISDG
jgi:metallophosphoesterase (TIGR00282 family)